MFFKVILKGYVFVLSTRFRFLFPLVFHLSYLFLFEIVLSLRMALLNFHDQVKLRRIDLGEIVKKPGIFI